MPGLAGAMTLAHHIMNTFPGETIQSGAEDFESAFTSLPLKPCEAQFNMCHAIDPDTGKLNFFQHLTGYFGGAPFGYAWARAVRPLIWILCNFLAVMGIIHVDDIVWADTETCSGTAALCIETVAKLCGFPLKASKHRGPCMLLEALGGSLRMPTVQCRSLEVTLKPSKREKYIKRFWASIREEKLSSPTACKLAGVMQWAQCVLFGRVGRAFLWPIYQRANYEHDQYKVGEVLDNALRGCLALLLHGQCRTILPDGWDSRPPLRIYVDAAGKPPCIAGVAFLDDSTEYFATEDIGKLSHWLTDDEDIRIAELEAIACLVALQSWASVLSQRRVWLYTDNEAAFWTLTKGLNRNHHLAAIAGRF